MIDDFRFFIRWILSEIWDGGCAVLHSAQCVEEKALAGEDIAPGVG